MMCQGCGSDTVEIFECCTWMFFIKFQKFLDIISSHNLSPFCLSSLFGIPLCLYWYALQTVTGHWGSIHLSSFFFLSVPLTIQSQLLYLLVHQCLGVFSLLPSLICHWASLENFFLIFIYLFILLHWVLVAARGIFSCGMQDLVPWPGIEPGSPALGAWSLSHWTTR